MPQDHRDEHGDPRLEELRRDAPVFAVAPVRTRTRLPRAALVGLVVGVAAFVAGIGVASAGPTARSTPASPLPVATAITAEEDLAPSADVTPRPMQAATEPTPSLVPPGTSPFLAGFDPVGIIAGVPGGRRCTAGDVLEKEVPRTRRDGPRITFQRSWLIWCPIPEARRQAFLLGAYEGLVDVIPAETFGYSAGGAGTGDALFPYAQLPLAGTVALTAGAAGPGLAIAIIVEEWRLDPAG